MTTDTTAVTTDRTSVDADHRHIDPYDHDCPVVPGQ